MHVSPWENDDDRVGTRGHTSTGCWSFSAVFKWIEVDAGKRNRKKWGKRFAEAKHETLDLKNDTGIL